MPPMPFDLVPLAAALATVAAGLAGLGWLVRSAWRFGQLVNRLADDLLGEPARPGSPARPGVMERLDRIEEELAEIRRRFPRVPALRPRRPTR